MLSELHCNRFRVRLASAELKTFRLHKTSRWGCSGLDIHTSANQCRAVIDRWCRSTPVRDARDGALQIARSKLQREFRENRREKLIDFTFLPREDIAHPANAPAAPVAELTRLACVKPPGIDRGAFMFPSPSIIAVSGYIMVNMMSMEGREKKAHSYHRCCVCFQALHEQFHRFESLISYESG